ncbi:MAG: DMT family transporter [Alphaproteobacteria bacterium]|nr:DMT family transporter [Alphaproteobacteria bacterium]
MSAGLLFALAAAPCWAALDAQRKALARHLGPLPLFTLLILGQIPLYLAWSLSEGLARPAPAYLGPGVADAALNLVAQLLFVGAVRVSPLSLTIPMLSLTPVFAVGTGWLFLAERPGPVQAAGIAAVVAGAAILQSGGGLQGLWRERGVWMMTGVAACWSMTMVFDKLCLRAASVPTHALLQALGMAAGAVSLLALRRELRSLSAAWPHRGLLAFAAITACAATGLQLFAVERILVSLVEAIKRAFGLAASVVNGRVFFGEPITGRKVAAIAVMGAGVVTLLLG